MFYLLKKANQGVCTNYFKVGSWIQSPHSVTSRLSSSKNVLNHYPISVVNIQMEVLFYNL